MWLSVHLQGLFNFLLDFVVVVMITLSGQSPCIYILLKVLYTAKCCTCMISVAVGVAVPFMFNFVTYFCSK
jgi:hypothetical protein